MWIVNKFNKNLVDKSFTGNQGLVYFIYGEKKKKKLRNYLKNNKFKILLLNLTFVKTEKKNCY